MRHEWYRTDKCLIGGIVLIFLESNSNRLSLKNPLLHFWGNRLNEDEGLCWVHSNFPVDLLACNSAEACSMVIRGFSKISVANG